MFKGEVNTVLAVIVAGILFALILTSGNLNSFAVVDNPAYFKAHPSSSNSQSSLSQTVCNQQYLNYYTLTSQYYIYKCSQFGPSFSWTSLGACRPSVSSSNTWGVIDSGYVWCTTLLLSTSNRPSSCLPGQFECYVPNNFNIKYQLATPTTTTTTIFVTISTTTVPTTTTTSIPTTSTTQVTPRPTTPVITTTTTTIPTTTTMLTTTTTVPTTTSTLTTTVPTTTTSTTLPDKMAVAGQCSTILSESTSSQFLFLCQYPACEVYKVDNNNRLTLLDGCSFSQSCSYIGNEAFKFRTYGINNCREFCEGTVKYARGSCNAISNECIYTLEDNSRDCGYFEAPSLKLDFKVIFESIKSFLQRIFGGIFN